MTKLEQTTYLDTGERPEPRIVAECWTCRPHRSGGTLSGDPVSPTKLKAQDAARCCAAEHDVRPVERGEWVLGGAVGRPVEPQKARIS